MIETAIELKYTVLEYPGEDASGFVKRYRIDGFRALSVQNLPVGYMMKHGDYCATAPGGELIVYDSNSREYMGRAPEHPEGVVIGYRNGDVLLEHEFSRLVSVLKSAGNRLHEMNERIRKREPTVLKTGTVVI